MAHGKKEGFHAPCAWCVGESDIALTHVAYTDKSRSALHILQSLFKALQARYTGKSKAMSGSKLIPSREVAEEVRRIPKIKF
jgi:hypothetical protein